MTNIKSFLYRWLLSIIVMAAIFKLSSTPGDELPNFGLLDYGIKKGGHMLGYGLLSLAYWHGLKWNKKTIWWAWLFAVLFAISDEFHQSFVSGRHPSAFDVILFDAPGAAIALWIKKSFFS